MITIPVVVCGDHWANPNEVRTSLLHSDLSQTVCLDFAAEGPSLEALGVFDMLDRCCQQTGRSPASVYINNNPNGQEHNGYQNNTLGRSHFWGMSDQYWRDPVPAENNAVRLGFFVGRRTISRAVMMWESWKLWKDQTLMSLMMTPAPPPWEVKPQGINLESPAQWIKDIDGFLEWWNRPPIGSIDRHTVKDQYTQNMNTNRDLLEHYHKFHVELVAETYTLGKTFFPTEKTVRPLLAGKPCVIYGPRGFLSNLRSLGFVTWNNVWNEDYDDYEGPERWRRMKESIGTIMSKNINNLVHDYHPVSRHNRRILANMLKKPS